MWRLLIILVIVLAACGQAPTQTVEVVSVERVTVEVTRIVTKEIEVTRLVKEEKKSETPTKNAYVPTNTRGVEDSKAFIREGLVDAFETLTDVEKVNLARYDKGVFEVEVQTAWASQDKQPIISWMLVDLLAYVFGDMEPGQRITLTGSEDFTMVVTTYSTDGKHRYKSETDFATLEKVNNQSISYVEWIILANAGFR